MSDKLLKMQGEKLPCEPVWVDRLMMYEVHDPIEIDINGEGVRRYIITDIIDEGLIVASTQ